jgi:tetraacyldisaccharide 4'-kinase
MLAHLKHLLRSRADRFAEFTADVIYDRAEGAAATGYGTVLHGLSYIFAGIVRTRFFLYDNRLFRDTPLGCKVVVVGNLTVGGTGKTPVVEKMARSLAKRGRKVAILSRGYKSKSDSLPRKFKRWLTQGEKPEPAVVSDGKNILLPCDIAGDEPYMLARNLLPEGVVVVVNRDRVEAGAYAVRKFGVDTIILDDGLQYLPLRGQINLLLVDKNNPFGNRRLLPRGILREPVRNLRRGSYIFITKSDGKPDPELRAEIEKYKHPSAGVIECAHKPKCLRSVDHKVEYPLNHLKGRRVAAFSGIATPERFEAFLRDHGAQIVYNRRFLDHHWFDAEDIDEVLDGAKDAGAELVLTTEKDAVRLPDELKTDVPLLYLRLEVEILDAHDTFDAAVDRIVFNTAPITGTVVR